MYILGPTVLEYQSLGLPNRPILFPDTHGSACMPGGQYRAKWDVGCCAFHYTYISVALHLKYHFNLLHMYIRVLYLRSFHKFYVLRKSSYVLHCYKCLRTHYLSSETTS